MPIANRLALQKWLNQQEDYQQPNLSKLLDRCRGTTFQEFNKIIGLPRKNGVEMPIFDYEDNIAKLLFEDKIKFLLLKKSVGLGITECLLRIMLWRAMRDNAWSGRQAIILTGPSINLSVKLIKRLKNLLEPHQVFFTSKETFCEINRVSFESFPSHNPDSYRSLTSPAFILVPEAEFFPATQQQDVRLISERYIAKSGEDFHIVLESTPGAPGGLFDTIEREPNSIYHKLTLDCYVGLNKIYTQEEIDNAKKSASFASEMSPLLFLGGAGNVFSDYVVSANTNGEYSLNPSEYQFCIKSAGIDWGAGSSKTALVICAYVPEVKKIRVIFANQWERPDYSILFPQIWSILSRFQVKHLYCDGSSPSNVTYFMKRYGDDCYPSYNQRIKFYKSQYQKLNNDRY